MRLPFYFIKWLLFTKKLANPLAPTSLNFRVMPFDIDYNLHLNNAKYLSFMDLGRFHLIFKIGIEKEILKNKWQVVAAGVNIMYRRPIAPFAKFTLDTKILCWDEKWFYIEQDFVTEGKICARAIVRVGFTKKKLVAPSEILRKSGIDIPSPKMPIYLQEMNLGEKHFIEYTKSHSNS